MSAFFRNIYQGKKVLLTGHTGFKGSWLGLWLHRLGARVAGFSLESVGTPSHFELLNTVVNDHRGDIGNFDAVFKTVREAQPEIVFHLAAQSLVRPSYRDPIETYRTNVMGTLHLLEACRRVGGIKAIVLVSSDKCYENTEWIWGYRENDRLGGYDPYSSSKACCEILASSFRRSFPGKTLVASCRAGNVIGGGDWAEDRLVPDLVRAAVRGEATPIRMPEATRPWQHVLEPLSGYLLLGCRLLEGKTDLADAWNFGPGPEGNLKVCQVADLAASRWSRIRCDRHPEASVHEATNLMLDCSKARRCLDWRPTWDIEEGIARTFDWYRVYYEEGRVLSEQQLDEFTERAIQTRAAWTDKNV